MCFTKQDLILSSRHQSGKDELVQNYPSRFSPTYRAHFGASARKSSFSSEFRESLKSKGELAAGIYLFVKRATSICGPGLLLIQKKPSTSEGLNSFCRRVGHHSHYYSWFGSSLLFEITSAILITVTHCYESQQRNRKAENAAQCE